VPTERKGKPHKTSLTRVASSRCGRIKDSDLVLMNYRIEFLVQKLELGGGWFTLKAKDY
jgi:hypothetical protein